MTDEELDELAQEISGEIEQLSGDSENTLGKAEKRHLRILGARLRALVKIKAVKEKGAEVSKETKATKDKKVAKELKDKETEKQKDKETKKPKDKAAKTDKDTKEKDGKVKAEKKAKPKEGTNNFPTEDLFFVFCNNPFYLQIWEHILQSSFYDQNEINNLLQQNPIKEWI